MRVDAVEDNEDGIVIYRENTRLELGGDGPIRGFDMSLNNFSRRIFAATTAAGDRQVSLYFAKRRGTTIHDFADLAIADGMAQTDVHGCRISPDTDLDDSGATHRDCPGAWDPCKYKCE